MGRCELCGRENVSLLWAVHKRLGGMWVCADCWKHLFEENLLVSGSGESGCGC